MDTAAKTSEDTASTSLHIKGTPTASQETNCIPNNQNTAKTSIPSTSAQLKRRSFRRFLAIAAVSTCVSSGCQSFRLGISRNPVSETMQGMYQILDGK